MSCLVAKNRELFPKKLALVLPETTLSYEELDTYIETKKEYLQRKGIGAGDLIATYLPSSVELLALFFAAWRLKASLCPLNLRLPPQGVQASLLQLSPKLFFSPTATTPYPGKTTLFSSLALFTSGSTAQPKICVHTLESLLASASHYPLLELSSSSRYLLSLPLYHVSGIGILLRTFLAGATLSLDPKDPLITHLSLVPNQLQQSYENYPHLQSILVGGAPPAHLPPHLPIYLTYGLTETASWVLLQKNPKKIDGRYYLGFPLPSFQLHTTQEQELLVEGPSLFSGYVQNSLLQKAPIPFPTKDLVHFDPLHGYAIEGRKDFQFISGGENIQPEEIERELLQIPGIAEALVLAKKDPKYGQVPLALLVRGEKAPPSLEEIGRLLQEKLPKYKVPKELHYVDALPKVGMKLDRQKAMELLVDGMSYVVRTLGSIVTNPR